MINKVCKIINDKSSWRLVVDDMDICFQGFWNADYFEKHYSALGYTVERDDNKYREEKCKVDPIKNTIKVGDTIVLRADLKKGQEYDNGCLVTWDMEHCSGQEVEVQEVTDLGSDGRYFVSLKEICHIAFFVSPSMIERVIPRKEVIRPSSPPVKRSNL